MKNKILLLLLLPLLCSSCFDNFLMQEPETKVTAANYWKTEKDVESAVYGMHSVFRANFGNVVSRLYRERAMPFDYQGVLWKYIIQNRLSNTFDLTSSEISWGNEYQAVASCNLVLDNLNRADMPEERRNYYEGQALTLRAIIYFYITRYWGDAPYITTSEDIGEKGRVAWQTIQKHCIEDLKRATELLPAAGELRDAAGAAIVSKQIPSQGTAWAFLAHIYAWLAEFGEQPEYLTEAIKACDQVIGSGDYELADNIKDLCNVVLQGNSQEGIFELDYRKLPQEENPKGSSMAGCCQTWPIDRQATPGTRRSLVRLSNAEAKRLFPDLADQRRSEYIYKLDSMSNISSTTTQGAAYICKFRYPIYNESGSQVGKIRAYDNNEILLRLADIILLRAELKFLAGDKPGAISDLNAIRERAGAPEYKADEDLWTAIADERDKELFLEGISRQYFDNMRTGNLQRLKGDFRNLTEQDIKDGAMFLPVANSYFIDNTLAWQYPYWMKNGFRL